MKKIDDKVVIITGASSGIGEMTAIKLSQLGAKVVLAARNEDKLNEIKQQIIAFGSQAISIKTDVSIETDIKKLINKTMDKWGRIDILISNAGQYIQGPINEIGEMEFKNSFAVNFYPSVFAVKSLIPIMSKQKSGQIVFINTLDTKKGIIGDAAYVAAKSALDGFGDVLRQEVKDIGIKVLTVYPGRIDTPMIQDIKVPWISRKLSPEKVVNGIIKGINRNKATVVVPVTSSLLGVLNELFPKRMDWFFNNFHLEGKKI